MLKQHTLLKQHKPLRQKTPLKRRTGLKARKGLNRKPIAPMSLKKLAELNAEIPARIALCRRAGGQPIIRHSMVRIKGKGYTLTTVRCLGGTCEICHRPATGTYLEPHENRMRSRGGKLSLENTMMAHHTCHMREGHRQRVNTESKPMWGGDR